MTDHRITWGEDYNFFTTLSITNSTFGTPDGYIPDVIIPFPTQSVSFSIESTGKVEYSFNGITVHGNMDSTKDSKTLIFDNRPIVKIWWRLVSGTGTVRIEAWGTRN